MEIFATLIWFGQTGERQQAQFSRDQMDKGVVIGRNPAQVDFTINDPHVSRIHARMQWNGREVVITDFGSINGVRLNGNRIAKQMPFPVSPNVQIKIGRTHLTLTM